MEKKTVIWNENRVPTNFCEWCGMKSDVATGENRPNPGDLSVCLGCGHLAKYDEDLFITSLSEEELTNIKNSKEWHDINIYITTIKQMARERRAKGKRMEGEK